MTRFKLSIGLLFAVSSVWAAPLHTERRPLSRSTVQESTGTPRQLWVKWKTATASSARLQTQTFGRTVRFSAYNNQVIELRADQNLQDVRNQLMKEHGTDIEFAVENLKLYPDFTPNDPGYSLQYHLPIADFPSAWQDTKGSGITIAIADTGVLASHSDLSGNMTSGYNTYLENTNTTDNCGHGTAVAGTAAAVGNNSNGITGGAFQATILPIKMVDDADCSATTVDIDESIRYAADHGARVVNVSFGSPSYCDADYLVSAAQYMRTHGGSVVKSAGNNPVNKGCRDIPEIVVVSATEENDLLTSFSNFGSDVDMSAPGQDILTTSTATTNSYVYVDGTSFSAPLTSSVLALIYAIDPAFTPAQAEQILFDSADDLGTAGRDIYFGYGRINAGRAMTLAAERSIVFQRASLSNVYAYPNPWDVRQGHAPQIRFANLPDGASVKIFTLSGFWVQTVQATNGQATWDMRNHAGENIASGLYFYTVSSAGSDNKVKGKLAVIR